MLLVTIHLEDGQWQLCQLPVFLQTVYNSLDVEDDCLFRLSLMKELFLAVFQQVENFLFVYLYPFL